jgi:TetR/AcrR family transcriptional regulator, tetracycline repressor protein
VTKTRTPARIRERLTRERVIKAALHIMDTEGLDAVTMRRVAREVGVEAMSLYNHVRDKDDLLDGIRLRVFSEFVFTGDGDAYDDGRAVARAWRELLKSHPHMLELLAEEHPPPATPEAFRPMETALAVLRRMGVPDDEAMQVFHAFGGYIQGFTMMESQLDFGSKHGGDAGLADLSTRIDAGELPCLAAALPFMLDCDIDAQFDLGLDLMMAGIQARYGRRKPAKLAPGRA